MVSNEKEDKVTTQARVSEGRENRPACFFEHQRLLKVDPLKKSHPNKYIHNHECSSPSFQGIELETFQRLSHQDSNAIEKASAR